jgi:periplasmic protein TonB
MIKTVKAIAFFSLAYLIIGNLALFAQDSSAPAVEDDDKIFMVVEEMPSYKNGGQDGFATFLSKEISYPKEARKQNIQGTVFVSFIVEKDGSVTTVEIVRGVDKMLDNEALRVVGLTKWTPGKQSGKTVRTRFVVPIAFKLENSKKKNG